MDDNRDIEPQGEEHIEPNMGSVEESASIPSSPTEYFTSRTDLGPVKKSIEDIKAEIGKIIVGQDKMIELLLAAIFANGHVLIEGFPGVGKTLTAKILSRTIDANFSRIQFTPDLMPSDILGTSIFNYKTSEFEYKQGPIFSNIVLIDEINRSPAKTQAALFEVMEERQVTMDGTRYKMSDPFLIVATQNPIELEGTYRLPEAQMDRFLFKITVDYPELDNEVELLRRAHNGSGADSIEQIQKILSPGQIAEHRALTGKVVVEDKLMRYIAEIVNKTRNFRDIEIGASPRGSLAIMAAAKSIAVIRGRDFVTPDDIQYVVDPVLSHRITIAPEREMEGVSPSKIINALMKSVEVPR